MNATAHEPLPSLTSYRASEQTAKATHGLHEDSCGTLAPGLRARVSINWSYCDKAM